MRNLETHGNDFFPTNGKLWIFWKGRMKIAFVLLLNALTLFLKYTKEVDTYRESTATLPPMVLGQDLRIIT